MGAQQIAKTGDPSQAKVDKGPEQAPLPLAEKLAGQEEQSSADRQKALQEFLKKETSEEARRINPKDLKRDIVRIFRDPKLLKEMEKRIKKREEERKKEGEAIEHLVQSLETFVKKVFEKIPPLFWF